MRRILVASADSKLADTIGDLIAPTPSSRFACQTAPTLSQTLAVLGKGQVDAILLDLQLDGVDGLATMKAVKEKAQAPILILTQAGSEALSLKCLEEGAQEYVPKENLDTATLRRALGYAISRHRADDLRLRLEHSDRLAALGQLTAGVAHEINNPATYVLSNLNQIEELVQKRLNGTESESDLDLIAEMTRDCRNGIELIASISRELTYFARTEDDSVDVINIKELITNSSTMTLNEIRYRAKFEQRIGEVPDIVGSRSKLSQVLVNLLINAAHAIDSGDTAENQITISAAHEGDHAVIRVKDTGGGIPESAMEKIFENYYTTKPQGQGTGLGLPICREIVLQHKGTLDVSSRVGEGTTFTVSLPIDSERVPAARAASVSEAVASSERRRVLLIDDEPLLLKSIARMLQSHHDVVSAIGGEKALAILAADSKFDTVICDLMMPVVDGLHVHDALEADYPQLVNKLVYLSGGVFTDRMAGFLEDKEPRLLDKPVSREDLLEAIAIVPAG